MDRRRFHLTVCLALAVAALACLAGPARAGGVQLAGSRQGQSIAFLDYNGDTMTDKLVGAPYAVSSRGATGAVLVYSGNAMGGYAASPTKILQGDENFGYSIAVLGDAIGDGGDDFAVGAISGGGPGGSLTGSVTIYNGRRGEKGHKMPARPVAKLTGEGPMDKFGYFITAGDLDGDGKKDLIVGAPFNTPGPALYQGGAVYVYFAPDFTGGVALHATPANKGLGWSAACGDLNGDGVCDLSISASGKVLCYYGGSSFNPATNAPDLTVTCSASGFGKALAVVGDLTVDGCGELLIGAPNSTIGGNRDTGSLYVVKGGTGNRTVSVNAPSADLLCRIDGAALFDRFGSSVAGVADVDTDSLPDFAVGAPLSDADAQTPLAGKVYLFKGKDMNSSSTLASATAFKGVMQSQWFGSTLVPAPSGTLLIGAPRTDMDNGGVVMVDLSTGEVVPGGSSGGTGGDSGGCH